MTKHIVTISGIFATFAFTTACGDGREGQGGAVGVGASDSALIETASGELLTANRLGRRLFFQEFPDVQGNGRTCNTCHVAEDGFQLSPAHVEERWQALQQRRRDRCDADDPLFRSIDADDFDSDFTTLRRDGLVRVNIQMASNVRVLDDPTARSVAVWRSTPTVFNVALTAPYQWDGRFPDLAAQALGALRGHAEIGRDPPARLLDAVSAFETGLFPDLHSLAVATAVREGTPLPSEPEVSGPAIQGKAIFQRECAFCHSGPTLNRQQVPGLFLGNILISKPLSPFADPSRFPPSPPLPVRMWAVTLPDGSEVVRPSTDPGKLLITGDPRDFNQFEISQLRGLARTAPYFHDNSAKTLQDVARQYQGVFAALRAGGNLAIGSIADDEIEPLVAYLSTL